MRIFENIINHKINTITARELLKYGKQFQIAITKDEAEKITSILRGSHVNIFNDKERTTIIKKIEKIAGAEVAKGLEQLFINFTK